MKRLYKVSSHIKTEDGFVIQLDGKSVKTPSGQPMASPSRIMADVIVKEWADQGEQVVPDTMPVTQMLTTAIDRMRERDAMTKSLLKYLDTDLLCYRVKEPVELAKRQKEVWDRWLTWFDEHFESPLDVTFGLDALTQDADTHKQIWNYLEALDEYYFTVLQVVTSLSGSIVLGLAFLEHEASPEDVYNAAELEEIYHSELAGEDVHGSDPVQERRQATMRRDLAAAKKFMELLEQE
ncbi:MAG: ATP12 chaperone family protein [Micavibrio aeruginosavorus]|uniref:ATP12 chaperone family protein n=1 Tax=Micavibrio aeruginosavorus TaxID=349221 RepID=A0A2W5MW04_9BACT|nr:MAG: ATP12 chaperone family protein [Micavibrio aeruginosavorus]